MLWNLSVQKPFLCFVLVLAGPTLLLPGCGAAGSQPPTLPPQTLSQVSEPQSEMPPGPTEPSQPVETTSTEQQTPQEAKEARVIDDRVIVIEFPTEETPERPSLIEAAEAERRRRRQADPPVHVITDKNLSEYATGELTVAEEPEESEAEAGTIDEEVAAPPGRGEEYWRSRARQIRLAWRDSSERIEELESKVAEMRLRFYAEDNPYYRDSQIKPAWDWAIEQLEEAKRSVVADQKELAELMEEGRRAQALPGWLREGIELEPDPEPEDYPIHEPAEPVIFREDGGAR